jgi:hypothetical protein
MTWKFYGYNRDCSYTNKFLVLVEGLDKWQDILLRGIRRTSFGWVAGFECSVTWLYRPMVCVGGGLVMLAEHLHEGPKGDARHFVGNFVGSLMLAK